MPRWSRISMVRECRPPAREPGRAWLARRSTTATSTPANASSPANISPVGPAPAMTTACSVIASVTSFRAEIRRLSVEREVQSALHLFSDAHRREPIDEPEHPVGEAEGPQRSHHDRGKLFAEEREVARKQSIGPGRVEGGGGEHSQQDDPQEATYAMDAPHVEGVIELETVLQGNRVIADGAGR